jgi:hypothetical protein
MAVVILSFIKTLRKQFLFRLSRQRSFFIWIIDFKGINKMNVINIKEKAGHATAETVEY